MSNKQVTRKSSRESAGKTTRKTDYIHTNVNTSDNDNAVNNNGAAAAAASVTITGAHNPSNPQTTTTTTISSMSMMMPSCVSITNTVPTICNTTPINISKQNNCDDFLMNVLQKLDSKMDKNMDMLNNMSQQLACKADVKTVNTLAEKVTELELQINELKVQLNTRADEASTPSNTTTQDLPELVKQELSEQNLIRARKNNLIIKKTTRAKRLHK